MSKRAEEAALKAYPPTYTTVKRRAKRVQSERVDTHQQTRAIFQQGYEKAEKDIISYIREQIEKWMPKDNREEHIKGERTAFNSVLHLLKEMEEEQ